MSYYISAIKCVNLEPDVWMGYSWHSLYILWMKSMVMRQQYLHVDACTHVYQQYITDAETFLRENQSKMNILSLCCEVTLLPYYTEAAYYPLNNVREIISSLIWQLTTQQWFLYRWCTRLWLSRARSWDQE